MLRGWWGASEDEAMVLSEGQEMGSTAGPGRSHMLGNLCTTTIEPVCTEPRKCEPEPTCCNCQSPCASSPCSTTREATARRPHNATKSSPCSPQLEKSLHSNEDPAQAKINRWIKLLKCIPSWIINYIAPYQFVFFFFKSLYYANFSPFFFHFLKNPVSRRGLHYPRTRCGVWNKGVRIMFVKEWLLLLQN